MAPNARFYSGTRKRVGMVVGEPGGVEMACNRMMTTIYTAIDASRDTTATKNTYPIDARASSNGAVIRLRSAIKACP